MTGWAAIAVSPSVALSVGTSRQPKKRLAFLGSDRFPGCSSQAFRARASWGRKHVPTRVLPGVGQRDASRRHFAGKKRMWDLDQDSRAVAGIRIAAAGAPVGEVTQDGQRLADDFMGFFAFDIDDKSCAAGIMLEIGVIQPLLGGQASRFHAEAVPLLNQVVSQIVDKGWQGNGERRA